MSAQSLEPTRRAMTWPPYPIQFNSIQPNAATPAIFAWHLNFHLAPSGSAQGFRQGWPRPITGPWLPPWAETTMDCCPTPSATEEVGYTDGGVVPQSTAKLVPWNPRLGCFIDPSVLCGVGSWYSTSCRRLQPQMKNLSPVS